MKTVGPLADRTKKELAEMARRRGVRNWEALNKEELVKALSKISVDNKTTTKPVAKPARLPSKPIAKPALKSTAKTAVAKPTPTAKAAPKAGAKLLPKPAAKSAAKVTKPTKAVPEAAPPRSTPIATTIASPAANGAAHRIAPNANGTPAAIPSHPKPATATGKTPSPASVPAPKPAVTTLKPAVTTPKPAVPAVASASRELPKEPPPPKAVSGPTKDRIIMAVHDPYWLHVYWELSAQSVQRAEAALKQDWYGARLIIRLYDVTSQDTTSTSETPIRDIPIESDGSNWYINVHQPPRQYRADLGYLSRRGILFVLARSNVVTPPKAGSSEVIDATWNMDTKKAERILAMSTGFESSGNPELREVFEERLKKSLGAPKETGFGTGATPPGSLKKFFFEIDAKLIVFGRTDPTAHLTLGNDPIKLSPDGTFVMSFSLPDSRQIIPAVATSADGVEERTIVLAVERNTKYLDPMIHDQMNEL